MADDSTMPLDHEAIMAAMQMAERVPEPSGTRERDVVYDGSDSLPTPMMVATVTSAGYARMWDTETGDESITNMNMLPAQLKKTRPNGRPFFTVVKPNFEPKRGKIKCRLHADDPERGHFDFMGFAVCNKSNLTSPHQLERHMAHRHQDEWATIQHELEEQEKKSDREFQRSMLSMAVRGRGSTPEESATDNRRAAATALQERQADRVYRKECPECDEVFESTGQAMIAGSKLRWHKNKVHGDG